jgi:predicted nucleotidyltransferase
MDLLVKMIFGSHLYGTDTPDSDRDYKGIYMPTGREVLLGRIPKSYNSTTGSGLSKNTAEDVDCEIYSLHYFLRLAYQGETAALDMLHAPASALLCTSDTWQELVSERHRFYTRNLNAFVGYARRQAAKYGIKGSRLSDAKQVLELLRSHDPSTRLSELWELLPEGEHARKLPATDPRHPHRLYQVCGRKLIDTARVGQHIETLARFVDAYGERARKAEANEGIDWKAVSHAFRAGFQVRSILSVGTFSYPLPEAAFLRVVKAGKLPYREVGPMLDRLIDECEELAAASTLPEACDRVWWDDWLVRVMEESLACTASRGGKEWGFG